MRAIEVLQAGGPETLQWVEKPKPRAGESALLIRVLASGVNFADILCREARHPGMTPPPLIPGCEAAGVVEQVGSAAKRFQVGDRVAVYSPPGGSYADYMTAPEDYCLPLPTTMTFEQGAAFCHVFLTAYHALVTLARARTGEKILVTAAAGGVGSALLQIARVLGLETLAAVGSSQKRSLTRELGASETICYGNDPSNLDPAWLGTVDVALESVGGTVFERSLGMLRPLGRTVIYGFASGEVPALNPYQLLSYCGSVSALNLSVIFAHRPDLIRDSWKQLTEWFEAGRIRPLIHHSYPLPQARLAHQLMESRQSTGKILLLPETD